MIDETLREALRYLSLGYSIFPLHARSKIPAIKWEKYQTEKPSVDEVSKWFSVDRNIAIVTGQVSGLVVMDIDTTRGGEYKPLLEKYHTDMVCKTGKGFHLYYTHPGWTVTNDVDFLPGVDVRGDGGYVVAPPSTHPNGSKYEWLTLNQEGSR